MGVQMRGQMGLHSVWFLSLLAAALPTSGASLFEVPADASGFDFGAVSAPVLPTQFSGTIETVALLLDKDIEYPPRVKRYEVHYDWDKKMAKVAVTAGDDASTRKDEMATPGRHREQGWTQVLPMD